VTLRHVVLLVGVLALGVLVLGAQRARAASWQSPLTSQQVADAVAPIARRAWPGSRCAGRERVEVDNRRLYAQARGDALARGERLLGYAVGAPFLRHRRSEACLVVVREGMMPRRVCSVLAHEFGHLAGRRHTRTGIMVPYLVVYRPCLHVAGVLGTAALVATELHLARPGSHPRCTTSAHARLTCAFGSHIKRGRYRITSSGVTYSLRR
jgi:hypothetical protein